jgi:hypothetical protein
MQLGLEALVGVLGQRPQELDVVRARKKLKV